MSRYAALGNCLLSPGNAFKDGHPLLHELIGLNVQKIGAWQAMLGDENGFFVPRDVREEFSCLALEGGDEFGAHEVTL